MLALRCPAIGGPESTAALRELPAGSIERRKAPVSRTAPASAVVLHRVMQDGSGWLAAGAPGEQRREGPRAPLPLVLVVVVEQDVRAARVGRQRLHLAGDLVELVVAIIVVEALRRRRESLAVPRAVIASVQPHDGKLGIGDYPHGRNGVRNVLRLVDHDVDEPVVALEREGAGG